MSAQSSSKKVLLLLEASREYGRGLLRGILGYNILHESWFIEWQEPFYRRSESMPNVLRDVDGIIMREQENNEFFLQLGVPIIFASYREQHVPGTYRITTNDKAICQCAAEHFRERGIAHFAYLGYDDMYWSENRKISFCQAVQQQGRPCNVFAQSAAGNDWNTEKHEIAEWLTKLTKPVGVFCCNDDRARQVRDVCRLARLAVPDEVAIIGVDNDELICNAGSPPISSVALNLQVAGYNAAELLNALMQGKTDVPRKIVIEPSLVVTRQSSKILAVTDPVVISAVRFIQKNCRRPIQVDDVADFVAVSRSALYHRFKRVLNCGVHTYIKKTRIEEIKKLLVKTDLTITNIAHMMEFTSPDHIASYFRSHAGINPHEYRLRHRPA